MDVVPMPMVLIRNDQRIEFANGLAGDLLGTGIEGRHYTVVLRQPAISDGIESVLSGKTAKLNCTYIATEAMREATYRVTVARLEVNGQVYAAATFVDATDMYEAGQIRRDFVANVSHELRTPLTALIGFIETLKDAARDDTTARERFLEVMDAEANRMNRLVSDLLSLSRVESEQRMRPTDVSDVAGILMSVISSLQPLADENGVEIAVVGADAPVKVFGDDDQLAQVFSNLIENALKYGGRGSHVEATLEQRAYDPNVRGPSATVTIADDGDGFDPIHIPRLTARFYRIDTHRSRELGGTGLGLAIVKHIVTRHRGRFRIESTPKEGSRFSVTLPLE